MTVERRFLTGYELKSTDEAGLVLGEDGAIEVVAPGGARSPLGAGGSAFVPLQGIYDGITAAIDNGQNGFISWNAAQPGSDELLDRADPLHPTVLADGVYALTAFIEGNISTGFYNVNVGVTRGDFSFVFEMTACTFPPSTETVISFTLKLEAGDMIELQINNRGGITIPFSLTNAALVKLS